MLGVCRWSTVAEEVGASLDGCRAGDAGDESTKYSGESSYPEQAPRDDRRLIDVNALADDGDARLGHRESARAIVVVVDADRRPAAMTTSLSRMARRTVAFGADVHPIEHHRVDDASPRIR